MITTTADSSESGGAERREVAPATPTDGGPPPVTGGVMALHAALLFAVLTVAAVLVGPGAFSADEGAAIVQARMLAAGEGWVLEHPFPAADPDGLAYPYELSTHGERGIAPFAKHPLYAAMLGLGEWAGGRIGMVLWSVLGTTLAAVAAGRIALRLEPSTALWALWVVGIGSPLLFSSSLLIAHAPGAGLAGLATLAAIRHLEVGRWAPLAGLVVANALLAGLRTEGLLFTGALAVALLVVRAGRRGALAAAASLVGAAAGYLLNGWMRGQLLGGMGPSRPPSGVGGGSYLDDRLTAFVITWIRPAYDPIGSAGVMVMLGVILLAGGAFLLGRGLTRPATVLSASGAALLVLRVLFETPAPVPGLLMAFPLLAAGIGVAAHVAWSNRMAQLVGITVALAWIGVLATQYRFGGTGEWGGRYFTLGIPLVVPLVMAGLAAVARARPRGARPVFVALAVATLAMSTLSLSVMHRAHRDVVAFADLVTEVSDLDPADGGTPVIVATAPFVPRMIWELAEDRRILLVPRTGEDFDAELAAVVGRLEDLGVRRWTFVTYAIDEDGPRIAAERFDLGEPRRAAERSRWLLYPAAAGADGDEQMFGREPLS